MAQPERQLDIEQLPELLRLAEEVSRTGETLVLTRGAQWVARLSPAQPRRRRPRAQAMTEDDPVFDLVGLGRSGVAGGISEKKDEYRLQVHRRDHR